MVANLPGSISQIANYFELGRIHTEKLVHASQNTGLCVGDDVPACLWNDTLSGKRG